MGFTGYQKGWQDALCVFTGLFVWVQPSLTNTFLAIFAKRFCSRFVIDRYGLVKKRT
jgi:hypothetical protein